MRSAFGPNAFRTDVNLSHPLRAAPDRDNAGPRDLHQAERQHERDEALDLVARAGDLEHETLGRGVNDTGAERVGEAERLHPMLAFAAHLDHGALARELGSGPGDVDAPRPGQKPVELILDLLDDHGRAARDDGDTGEMA